MREQHPAGGSQPGTFLLSQWPAGSSGFWWAGARSVNSGHSLFSVEKVQEKLSGKGCLGFNSSEE